MKITNLCFLIGVALSSSCFAENSAFLSADVAKVQNEAIKPATQQVASATTTDKPIKHQAVERMDRAAAVPAKRVSNSVAKQSVPNKVVVAKEVVEKKSPEKLLPKHMKKVYIAYEGQTYRSAIGDWFAQAGYPKMAWSVSRSMNKLLFQKITDTQVINGSLIDAMTKLSSMLEKQYEKKIYMSTDDSQMLGAVHQWPERKVRIVMIRRAPTLEATIKNLVEAYGWNWSESSSWNTNKQFEGFPIDFPIVAPADDIQFAIDHILDGRSVFAEVHDGTRYVFIKEI
ncbi:hypothetical protein OPW39_15820 [Vibrio europaeus]|uniref:hypothetical protein n=1 Tax=Vibrio europaeus TaxID=300876 RepID=UPI00233EF4E0|nr:hypothetical protein [Vibrio europaeus]MDC5870276.1 hypothetical protein [Vibrio europaeus]